MASEFSVTTSSVKAVFNAVLNHGTDVVELEKVTGITIAELDDQDHRIELTKYHKLWELAIKETGNPALGLELGKQVNPGNIGVVGHIVINSDTVGEGLKQYVRLFQAVNDSIRAELIHDSNNDIATVNFHCENTDLYCASDMERTLALILFRIRAFVDPTIKLTQICFQHQQPAHIDAYQEIFNCPPLFGQSHCSVSFETKVLEQKPPERNPYVHTALVKQAENLVNKLFRRALSTKTKVIIGQQLKTGELDADAIANQLHMSRNTLYRKLKHEGYSLQELIEIVRKEKAIQLLEDNNCSLSEIAFMLGFSELSAFSRAFKRWTGKSPKTYQMLKQKRGL